MTDKDTRYLRREFLATFRSKLDEQISENYGYD